MLDFPELLSILFSTLKLVYPFSKVVCQIINKTNLITKLQESIQQVPVVQSSNCAIQQINHYPLDRYYRKLSSYPLNSDLSNVLC